MPSWRASLIAALLVSGTLAHPMSQQARGPLAAIRILGGPVVTLDVPASAPAAFDAASAALQAANVRFELEGAVPQPARPLVDFARPPQRGAFLTGLTVSDALGAIASAEPRFQWSETAGIIRASFRDGGESPLDQRLGRVEVTGATVLKTLEQLSRQLFSDRETPPAVVVTDRSTWSPVASTATAKEKAISFALDNATVRDVLRAIGREHGALSWTVRYDSEPAGLDRAILTVFDQSRTFTMNGPAVPGPRDPPSADRLRLAQNGDIGAMLATYKRTARVGIGAELLRQPIGQRFLRSLPAIDLTGLPPDQAVAQIVALDSRYMVTERAGRLLVRPTPAALDRSVLATRVPEFARNNEPLDVAIGDLLQRIGAEMPRPSATPTASGVVPNAGDKTRQTLVTVALREPVTAREVLDAICASIGNASWTLRPLPGSGPPGRTTFSLQIESPDGWALSRTFGVANTSTGAGRTELGLPAELDRELTRAYPIADSAMPSRFLAVAAAASLPMGVELVPPSRFDDDPRYHRNTAMVPIGPGRISDTLAILLEAHPELALRVNAGVINIGPASSIDRPDHFLNKPLGAFRVSDMPAWQAVVLLRRRLQGTADPQVDAAATLPAVLDAPQVNILSRPVTVSLDRTNARDVLNTIVRHHGGLTWTVAYEPRGPNQAARADERDSVILLRPSREHGITSLRIAGDGKASATNARTPRLPSPPPSSRASLRTTIPVPFPDPRLDEEIDRLCRGLEVRCAIELLSATPPGWGMMRDGIAATYDFTGLTPPEAFDALVGLTPGLSWRLDGTVYRITSADLSRARNMPLDRRITRYEGRFESLTALINSIRELFTRQPASRQGATPVDVFGATGGTSRTTMSPAAGLLEPPLSLSLRNRSVRQILDEIARQHRGLSWSVQYIDANGTYPEFELRMSQASSATGMTVHVR